MTKEERALKAVNALRKLLTERTPSGLPKKGSKMMKYVLRAPSPLLNDLPRIVGILEAKGSHEWRGKHARKQTA